MQKNKKLEEAQLDQGRWVFPKNTLIHTCLE